MLFNSLQFLVFFAFVLSLYYALPHRSRWFLLLLASSYFYMVFVPEYILILCAVIIIDYFAAFLINNNTGFLRKFFLGLSLAANLGILCYFKYANFFLDNIFSVLTYFPIENPLPFINVISPTFFNIVLPIGLSFHTFQAMSYTIEVYRGNQTPEKHLGIYALYVLFFPQLVAGPIERPQNLLPQFKKEQIYSRSDLQKGLILMAWGFFKKVVIADRLAVIVDNCYSDINGHSSTDMWLSVFLYSIQIYCDFSGYSDIAIGAAKTMGIDLMENFKNPYLATSLTDFWRRWHISLSSWFRDYIYIPMGGNKVSPSKLCFTILLVFFLSGLWHGAKYTFLTWALIHALFLILEHFFKEKKDEPEDVISKVIKTIYVFIVTSLAWIFFRSQNTDEAFTVLHKLFTVNSSHWKDLPMNTTEFVFILGLVILLLSCEKPIKSFNFLSVKAYYSLLWILIITCYFFGVFNYKQFIYFQF